MIGHPWTGSESSSLALSKRHRFGKAFKSFDQTDYKFWSDADLLDSGKQQE